MKYREHKQGGQRVLHLIQKERKGTDTRTNYEQVRQVKLSREQKLALGKLKS